MTRSTFTRYLACAIFSAQVLMKAQTSEGYVSLFNGRDLGQWEGNQQVWKVEGGLLMGTSGGKIASALILGGRVPEHSDK